MNMYLFMSRSYLSPAFGCRPLIFQNKILYCVKREVQQVLGMQTMWVDAYNADPEPDMQWPGTQLAEL